MGVSKGSEREGGVLPQQGSPISNGTKFERWEFLHETVQSQGRLEQVSLLQNYRQWLVRVSGQIALENLLLQRRIWILGPSGCAKYASDKYVYLIFFFFTIRIQKLDGDSMKWPLCFLLVLIFYAFQTFFCSETWGSFTLLNPEATPHILAFPQFSLHQQKFQCDWKVRGAGILTTALLWRASLGPKALEIQVQKRRRRYVPVIYKSI